jgi:hypothetical protein
MIMMMMMIHARAVVTRRTVAKRINQDEQQLADNHTVDLVNDLLTTISKMVTKKERKLMQLVTVRDWSLSTTALA